MESRDKMSAVSSLMSSTELLTLADAFFKDRAWIQAYSLYRSIDTATLPADVADPAGIENCLGCCASNLGNHEKASMHFEKAFNLKPYEHVFFKNLVRSLFYSHQPFARMKICDAAIQNNVAKGNPKYEAELYMWRGYVNAELGFSTLALSDLTRALSSNVKDENSNISYVIGMILMDEDKFSKAIPYLDRVPVESEMYSIATKNIGICYVQLGQSEVALPYFEEAFAFAPNDNVIRGDLMNCLLDLSEYSEALVHATYFVDTMLPTEPEYVEYVRRKAICLSELGHYDAAEELLNDVLQMEPDNYYLHSSMARVHFDRGAIGAAFEHLSKVYTGDAQANNLEFAREALLRAFRASSEMGMETHAQLANECVLLIEEQMYPAQKP